MGKTGGRERGGGLIAGQQRICGNYVHSSPHIRAQTRSLARAIRRSDFGLIWTEWEKIEWAIWL